jgi:acyl carrier protein
MNLSEPEVLAILKSILVDDLNVELDPVKIDALTPLFEDGLNLDSIVIIELITQVEQRFDIEFADVDLRMSTFENLRALVKVIQQRTH